MKKSIKIISLVISIIIAIIGISWVFLTPIYVLGVAILYEPTIWNIALLAASVLLVGFVIYILYKYLLSIIISFQEKKKRKTILMMIGIVLAILIVILLKNITSTSMLLLLFYIIGTITIPIIMLGIALLEKSKSTKRKIIKTILLIVITIGIYVIHYPILVTATRTVIKNVQTVFVHKDEGTIHLSEYNLIYLENYKQKMESEGYLDKYDVENILRIVDSRTDYIVVHYIDEEEEVTYNSREKQLVEELGTKLQGNHYQFRYTHKDEQTDIYIEKYVNETNESEEKNADVFVNVEPNYEVTNTKADYENEDDVNFLFVNKVNLEKGTDTTINNLKILFAFDSERHNYIPSVEDEQLRNIESYEIYSSGMRITLKEGVTLGKKDYTLRINRYNENLVVDENTEPFYAYTFEPIATETKTGNGNTVIEFTFDNTYALGDLKNIEIIF